MLTSKAHKIKNKKQYSRCFTNTRGNLKTLQKRNVSDVWVGAFQRDRERRRMMHQQSAWWFLVANHLGLLEQTSGEACKSNFRPSQKDDHTMARDLL